VKDEYEQNRNPAKGIQKINVPVGRLVHLLYAPGQ